ncbi:MAG: hypothetical protein ACK4NP_01610 [Parvularculaceae bacterium]
MGEGIGSFLAATPWAPLAIAFLVGLGCGWLIWGIKGEAGGGAAGASDSALAAPDGMDRDDRKEIVVLRAELEAARALLDQNDGDQDEIAVQLKLVDEALKRANGRLKVIQRGLKR